MRRIFVLGLSCLLPALSACGDTGGDPTSDSASSTSTAGSETGSSTSTTTEGSATDAGTTTAMGSTSEMTTSPTTTASSTGGGDQGVMGEFGHPCVDDAECMAVLGPEGVCLKDILGVYALPGGYCSKLCMLPDNMTAYVPNDPACGDGVTCIGAMGYFEGCVIECKDNTDCPRMGYECRIMPQIGQPGDPTFCLMTDDNML